MIRINIDKKMQTEIEQIYLEDIENDKKGIFNVLSEEEIKNLLSNKFPLIYNEFYDNDKVQKEKVKALLLANHSEMKGYIEKFKEIFAEEETGSLLSDELLEKVFTYNRFAKRKNVDRIIRKMNVTVCPYCNRQYIFTTDNGSVRPQLDHYYPKSKYPYLALSLYNLIPCCSLCNMSKAYLDTEEKPIMYPFEEEYGYDAKFEIRIEKDEEYVKVMQGISDDFSINLNKEFVKEEDKMKIKTQMEKLHLDELYKEHTDYVKDIIKSNYINTPERMIEICSQFPILFQSPEEVKSLMYMSDIRKESWGKRPLSKLTHDINEQLKTGKIRIEKNSLYDNLEVQ